MIQLKGKNALVTGASRGAGQQIATGLARLGCNVVVHARTSESTVKTAEILQKYSVNVYRVHGELSDEAQVIDLICQVRNLRIQIDILYNNAAV
jgi:3-oxoacyl-[acyl-carrier protein] reductase